MGRDIAGNKQRPYKGTIKDNLAEIKGTKENRAVYVQRELMRE